MLKLKLHYFGHLIERANSLEDTLMLGKIEGKRRRGQHGMSWLNSITDSIDMNLSKLQEIVDKDVWLPEVHGFTKRHDLVTEQQQQSRDIAIKVSLKDELSHGTRKFNNLFRIFYCHHA